MSRPASILRPGLWAAPVSCLIGLLPAQAQEGDLLEYYLLEDETMAVVHCPVSAAGHLEVPMEFQGYPVTSIGPLAFHDCESLTEVVFPALVDEIGGHVPPWTDMHGAFDGCRRLRMATFLGNAPTFMGLGVFRNTDPDFVVRFLSGRSGFSGPWHPNGFDSYEARVIDEDAYPAASWLLSQGYEYDADLHQPVTGGGGTLLHAYALNLHPHRGTLPAPARVGQRVRLSFFAGRPELRYRVETSGDLVHWTQQGVNQSPPGPTGQATADLPMAGPTGFLRIVIESAND